MTVHYQGVLPVIPQNHIGNTIFFDFCKNSSKEGEKRRETVSKSLPLNNEFGTKTAERPCFLLERTMVIFLQRKKKKACRKYRWVWRMSP